MKRTTEEQVVKALQRSTGKSPQEIVRLRKLAREHKNLLRECSSLEVLSTTPIEKVFARLGKALGLEDIDEGTIDVLASVKWK